MATIQENKTGTKHKDCLPAPGSGNGTADTCVEKWKDKKDVAKRDLDEIIAEAEQAKKALEYAVAWESKLKWYFGNIEKTAELSDNLRRELSVMIAQVERVCKNAECTVEALKCLYCQVQNVYTESATSLVAILELLQKCIKCITDPALVRDKGITKAISDLEIKVKELDALYLDSIKKVIEALKCALVLFHSICEDHVRDEDYETDSLHSELEGLYDRLAGNKVVSDALECVATSQKLEPIPSFPLKQDQYYTSVVDQFANAQAATGTARDEYDRLKKEKEGLQACYNSLVDAIQTADKTKSGK